MKYFKIFNDEDNHNGFQYKDGLNTDTNPFNSNRNDDCAAGGLYFSNKNHIMEFLDYGNFIREVSVPKGTKKVKLGDKYRAKALFFHPRRDLREVSTWEWLIDEQGVPVTNSNNGVIIWASENGHLGVVKYLVDQGADVTVGDNYALRWSSLRGHLEVVKYLVEHGADVTAWNNDPLRCASLNGHLDVVKYLVEYGADVTADDNYAVRHASGNGHLAMVEYLLANGATLP